jgi:Ser/Thr protein kinase RdoA (MazF antagonist)
VPTFPGREVTLVLCSPAGELLGALPPVEAAEPWWQEVRPVVAAARAAYGVDVVVLRLLRTRDAFGHGGPVTYLAELRGEESAAWRHLLQPYAGPDPLAPEPLRLPYAKPGGPDADLAWADDVLAQLGRGRSGPAEQQRTWNLSSIWRLPTAAGPVWLKVVPPFFAHEGAMLTRLNREHPGMVPPLLATEGSRILLDHVPGGDNYDAGLPVLVGLVRTLVALQVEWSGRVDEVLALGAPDWRADAFMAAAGSTVERTAGELDAATLDGVRRLIESLPERFAAVAACGLPDTLVHGDFHPGNTVGPAERPVVLDWGDCGVGNPLFDQAAFTGRLDDAGRAAVLSEWARCWREAVPGSDPERAAELIRPAAALRQAMIYRGFLDQIEPDERVYHRADPADWLCRAATFAPSAGGG